MKGNEENQTARMRAVKQFGICARLGAMVLLIATARADDPSILGYTEPFKSINMSSAEQGVIAEVLVEEGAPVKKTQVVARLNTATLLAELDIAKAEAKLQTTRLKKLEELSSANRSTPEELDRARTDLVIKEAQTRKIEAQIEERTLRSPIDGVVTEIKRDPSEAVSAANPHVMTVVQVDKLIVNLFLPPARATCFKVGTTTNLQLLDEKTAVPATVEFVSPVTDFASGTVRVKFVIDNADGAHRSGGRCTLAE
jgi:RND family efflux transporter MFP subunit